MDINWEKLPHKGRICANWTLWSVTVRLRIGAKKRHNASCDWLRVEGMMLKSIALQGQRQCGYAKAMVQAYYAWAIDFA